MYKTSLFFLYKLQQSTILQSLVPAAELEVMVKHKQAVADCTLPHAVSKNTPSRVLRMDFKRDANRNHLFTL